MTCHRTIAAEMTLNDKLSVKKVNNCSDIIQSRDTI